MRAMRCEVDALNGLLQDAEYHTGEFYKSAIKKMQREIDVLNSSIHTAATAAVQSSQNGTIITGATSAELVANA